MDVKERSFLGETALTYRRRPLRANAQITDQFWTNDLQATEQSERIWFVLPGH